MTDNEVVVIRVSETITVSTQGGKETLTSN